MLELAPGGFTFLDVTPRLLARFSSPSRHSFLLFYPLSLSFSFVSLKLYKDISLTTLD
jgi:hypothetical protein